MGKRVNVGLDIGSSAVRAAEVVFDGKKSELVRFAQVGLPSGAVVEGEVRDAAAVTSALKRLWSDGGFSQKEVVLGVSSQRAMVRVLDMPRIETKELKSALRYEIGELLPIPLEQAVFDFSVLGPGRPKGDGGETTQVLVVVAQKDIVWEELNVVRRAGLKVKAVDASALALLRAVPPLQSAESMDAVVSLGAHLAVVAVRQGKTPRFVRTAATGADVAAEPAARAAAAPSRFVPGALRERPDARPGTSPVEPVVEEVRSSVEYFLSHAQGSQLERIELTGGGSALAGLAERLGAVLGVPAVAAGIVPTINRRALGISDAQLTEASQRWTTAVGLALWGAEGGPAPTLLPGEIRDRERQRNMIVLASVGVVAVTAGLGVLWYQKSQSVNSVNQETVVAKAQDVGLQQQIGKLQSVTQVQSSMSARLSLAKQALAQDVDWVALDRRITAAASSVVSITQVSYSSSTPPSGASGSSPAPGAGASPAPSGGASQAAIPVGSVTISASTTGGMTSVAAFIDREAKVRGVTDLWVSGATRSAPGSSTVDFSVQATITSAALSDRGAKLPGGSK